MPPPYSADHSRIGTATRISHRHRIHFARSHAKLRQELHEHPMHSRRVSGDGKPLQQLIEQMLLGSVCVMVFENPIGSTKAYV